MNLLVCATILAPLAWASSQSSPQSSPQSQPPSLEADLLPLVAAHCVTCHGDEFPEGDLDLRRELAAAPADRIGVVLDLRRMLASHEMPPPGEPQPEAGARARALAWLDAEVLRVAAAAAPDAGRVTMRRLTRHEYANTVRELLGVTPDLAMLPDDDLAYGFDTVGDAQMWSPLHVEKYAATAAAVAQAALPDPDPVTPPVRVFDADRLASSLDRGPQGEVLPLLSRGDAYCEPRLPRAGRYRIRIVAHAAQAGDDVARMELRTGTAVVERFAVEATRDAPATYAAEAVLDAGPVRIAARFTNDHYAPDHPDRSQRDRNLFVYRIEVEGPLDRREPTSAEGWLLPLDRGRGRADARARPMLRALMQRAWRRPVARDEVARIARVVAAAADDGDSFHEALRVGLQAVLVSPSFLFRVEPSPSRAAADEDLSPAALAGRLSYFLWGMPPDEALRDALRDAAGADGLAATARAMLDDPRAAWLATSFAAQWFELRALDEVEPDPERFPGWSPELAASARRETELLFETVMRERLPATALIDADFSFVDRRLAAHYGMPPVEGEGFARVPVAGLRLGGVLGHASVLALTSNPTRTSPVKRGKWVLDNLLDAPPPAPPPGSAFASESAIDSAASLREQLAVHRARPDCAICHLRMDPIGLALEGFDGVGRRRSADAGGTIDVQATLPDGTRIDGAADLRARIAADPAFRRALLRKLFLFGVGRAIRPADALQIEAAAARLPVDATIADHVVAIVRLDAFRRRSPASEAR